MHLSYLSYFSTITYVVGTQKKQLVEYPKQMLEPRIRKYFQLYAYLSGPMYYPNIGLVKDKILIEKLRIFSRLSVLIFYLGAQKSTHNICFG